MSSNNHEVNLKYDIPFISYTSERQNLKRPLVIRNFSNFKISQTLNKLRFVSIKVNKSDINTNDGYKGRKVYISKYDFHGIIVKRTEDKYSCTFRIYEELWHFSRTLFGLPNTKRIICKEIEDVPKPSVVKLYYQNPVIYRNLGQGGTFNYTFLIDYREFKNLIDEDNVNYGFKCSFVTSDNRDEFNPIYVTNEEDKFVINVSNSIVPTLSYSEIKGVHNTKKGRAEGATFIFEILKNDNSGTDLNQQAVVRSFPQALFNNVAYKAEIGGGYRFLFEKVILPKVNEDLPDNEKFELSSDVDLDYELLLELKYKSNYKVLQTMAVQAGIDIWAERNILFVNKKGKVINIDKGDLRFFEIKSTDNFDNLATSLYITGDNNVVKKTEVVDNDYSYQFERVVSNNNLKDTTSVDNVSDHLLEEFSSDDPDIKITLGEELVNKYGMETGDVIKITSVDVSQSVKGFYRIIQLNGNDKSYTLRLQYSKDGKFIPRLMDSLDISETILEKIQELEITGE